MKKGIIISSLFLLLVKTISLSSANDSTCTVLIPSKRIHTNDTIAYPIPLIVFHLGGSLIFSNGDFQLNGENKTGTKINLQDDLNFPSNYISPRINAYLRFNRQLQFLLDFNSIIRQETTTLKRDIQFGNTLFSSNSTVRSKFSMISYKLAYRYSLLEKKHYDLGFLIGISGLNYKLDIKQNLSELSEKSKVFLLMPLIGADAFVYLGKKVFIRGVLSYDGSPFNNYKFSVISFKPFIEYYFTKHIGVALKYNFAYTNIIDLSENKFDGKFKFQLNAVSLAASFRFY